jgi:UDP-N-acetylmuramate--alanine ligase
MESSMEHIHLIGIGGTGLSAIARVLLESGYTVSGSDMCDSQMAQDVQGAGANVSIGHAPENIAGADLVVRSSAIPDENVEVQAAQQNRVPVLKRSDFLGRLMADRQGIAVAGTHGKTTTTAMIAWMLTDLGQDPSFIVGGMVNNLGTNARAGRGSTFVIEADEYDRMFLGLKPQMAVITNVEHDHPDIYPTPKDFRKAFNDFVGCLNPAGVLLLCGDDAGSLSLVPIAEAKGLRHLTYAIVNPQSDYAADNLQVVPGSGHSFDFYSPGKRLVTSVNLQIPGEHNVLNALAALAIVDQFGLSLLDAAQALSKFNGTSRRFEVLGEVGGVTVIDDYAHHPTEIRATLAAAKERFPNQELWVVWQPHTYSRVQLLFDQFAASFVDAHHVIVPEIYRSREPVDPTFSAQQIVQAMRHKDAHFVPDLSDVTSFLLSRLKTDDVLLVLSAGNADQVSANVMAGLNRRS